MFSVLFLPFAPAALPWLIVSWSIVGVSGYQIWRIDHPGESARSAVGVRVRWLAPAAATFVVVLVLRQVDPVWLIAGVVVWVLVLVALGLILSSLAKTERDLVARSPSPAQIGEPDPRPPIGSAHGGGGEGVLTSQEPAVEPEPN